MVRHGQSEAHELGTRQTPDSPLSKRGRKEALVLGKRIKRWEVSFDKIFSSKLPRARETAEIIAGQLGTDAEVFEGIHEREQHPDLYGAELNSKIHKENVREYGKNSKNLDFRFRGKGESIRDVIKRAADFKKHLLINHSQQDLLVISHALFIHAFVAICVLGDDYHDNSFADLFGAIIIHNTGVSLLKCEEDSGRWKVIYLNNFSHLKDITS